MFRPHFRQIVFFISSFVSSLGFLTRSGASNFGIPWVDFLQMLICDFRPVCWVGKAGWPKEQWLARTRLLLSGRATFAMQPRVSPG